MGAIPTQIDSLSFHDLYFKGLPPNWPLQVLHASTISFVVHTIFSSSLLSGGMTAVFSAAATTIHALITPFFKQMQMLQKKEEILSFQGEILRGSISIIGAASLASALGYPFLMQILALNIAFYALIQLIGGEKSKSLSHANAIYVVPFPLPSLLSHQP